MGAFNMVGKGCVFLAGKFKSYEAEFHIIRLKSFFHFISPFYDSPQQRMFSVYSITTLTPPPHLSPFLPSFYRPQAGNWTMKNFFLEFLLSHGIKCKRIFDRKSHHISFNLQNTKSQKSLLVVEGTLKRFLQKRKTFKKKENEMIWNVWRETGFLKFLTEKKLKWKYLTFSVALDFVEKER